MIAWFSQFFSWAKKIAKTEKLNPLIISENISVQDLDVKTSNDQPIFEKVAKQPLAILKKLAPIRDLTNYEIEQIEQRVLVYKENSVLFSLGEKSEYVFYLLKGSVELQSDGAASYCVYQDTPLAHLPLNSGRICGSTAITKSPDTIILCVPIKIIQWWTNRSSHKNDNLEVMDIHLPSEIPHTQFFDSFVQTYRENKLGLPSLPEVAIKMRKAMEQENIEVSQIITIIQIDAAIVAKLIQVSNSALYASSFPIKNCQDAVMRLGFDTTRKLVMGICVKQLFSTKSPQLRSKMQELWKKSLHISSLCFVLAQESGEIEPEDALLAGLVCDIGAIPFLHFAEKNPDTYPNLNELQKMMPYLNPPVGTLVLRTLGFPNEMVQVPKHSNDWYYESGSNSLTLIDVVILAKLHCYIGTEHAKDLPYINSIPAYTKLKNGKLNPDYSLDIIVKAQKLIDTAMSMFM